jgi:hypothetical protein
MKSSFGFLSLDLFVQLFLLGLNLILHILGIFELYFLFLSLYSLFLIGVYQFLFSAPIHLIRKKFAQDITQFRYWHFAGSGVFLLVLWLGAVSHYDFGIFAYIYLFVLPNLIAYGYLLLTWQDYRSRKNYLNSRPTKFAF